MSSILRALKKLEEEKARSEGGQVDLTRDILRQSVPERSNPLKLPLLACALILIGGLGAWLLSSFMEQPSVVPPPSMTLNQVRPVPMPLQPAVQPAPHVLPPPVTAPEPVRPAQPAAGATPTAVPPASASAAAPVPQQQQPVTVGAAALQLPAEPAHPQLIISGIVYQDDPEGRLAVVNDLPVMAGTVIEGAVVEEIRVDGVVFSYQGKSFEIRFNP